jgi:2-polyprenyl-6-hydroxyphenyl methylase / 3-demethylubiquinone-9 3-methyltransferase
MRLIAYARRLRRYVPLNTVLKLPSPSSVAASAKSSMVGFAAPGGKSSDGGGGGVAALPTGVRSSAGGRAGGAGTHALRWRGQSARWHSGPQYSTRRQRAQRLDAPAAPHDAHASPMARTARSPHLAHEMLPARVAALARGARRAVAWRAIPSAPSACFSSAPPALPPPAVSSIDPAEVRKFAGLAAHWWSETRGPFAALHRMNAVRVPLIRRALLAGGSPAAPPRDAAAALPLAGFTVCDVGCGGGILAEALARLGATVTGIDAAPANVAAAAAHAALDPRLAPRLSYRCTTAEQVAVSGAQFDAVVASEVLEHVNDPPSFVASLAAMVKVRRPRRAWSWGRGGAGRCIGAHACSQRPARSHGVQGCCPRYGDAPINPSPLAPSLQPDGRLVVTTLNRTARSFLAAILAAEYALGLVPPGTHEWAKFVTPDELQRMCAGAGVRVVETTGLAYNPLTGAWSLTADEGINYAAVARKPRLADA